MLIRKYPGIKAKTAPDNVEQAKKTSFNDRRDIRIQSELNATETNGGSF